MNGSLTRSRSFSRRLAPAGALATDRNRPRAPARGGFTLIEVMVVIAIIAILATLTTLGVNKAVIYSRQVNTKTEMHVIELSLTTAARVLGDVPYIPSRITLFEDLTDPAAIASDPASVNLLSKMFPGFTSIDWDNNGSISNTSATVLGADKAWVFFLGGMQVGGVPIGFAKGVSPNDLTTTNRKGPFYDFKPNRLNKKGTFTYLDYWENEALIVYSNMSKDPTSATLNADNPNPAKFPSRYYKSSTPAVLFNNKGYQILSAGKDGSFATAQSGFASGTTPNVFIGYGDVGVGADDQANFSDSLLGKPID